MVNWFDVRLPLVAAPMFIVSSLDLVLASCRAGIIGAFPAGNPRAPETLETWLATITIARQKAHDSGLPFAPWFVNLNVSKLLDDRVRMANLDACRAAKVPLILTNMGDPHREVEAAHDWGGLVFHDVTTIAHAEKAIAAGVDGLMLVTGGAGGHAGTLNPFAFLPQVRKMFDGYIMLAGGIADGAGLAAALVLGADLVVMGTRFIATQEAGTFAGHKAMLVESGSADILYTDAIAGLPASFLMPSIRAAGLDPANLPRPRSMHRPELPDGVRAWKDIWSAGHSVGLVDDIPTVAALVDRMASEFEAAGTRAPDQWRARLLRSRTGGH
jgi:nitronate monooxygenase